MTLNNKSAVSIFAPSFTDVKLTSCQVPTLLQTLDLYSEFALIQNIGGSNILILQFCIEMSSRYYAYKIHTKYIFLIRLSPNVEHGVNTIFSTYGKASLLVSPQLFNVWGINTGLFTLFGFNLLVLSALAGVLQIRGEQVNCNSKLGTGNKNTSVSRSFETKREIHVMQRKSKALH